ncbi:hypothetical protein TWF481_005002 [Arthrobotrys musiformis]|uniref:DUF6604 domain-containing protein n=1 Tax=Arthrobotrys musiformis TaxID=47236 RepID=A0AAV9WL68_9PEZI
MLPSFLKNSYHRYKADTSRFTEWLIETAVSCGVDVDTLFNLSSSTPAKRAQKITKIPLRGYAMLVDIIVQHDIKLPKAVKLVLERAIHIRRKFAMAFKDRMPDAKSDKGHLHFITILQDALEKLTSSAGVAEVPGKKKPKVRVEGVSFGHPIPDLLENLTLDDNPVGSDDGEGDNDKDVQEEQKPQPRACVKHRIFVIEDEYELEFPESFFMAFCLLDDLCTFRDFIKETWTEYKEGIIDAMTASVTTNSAVILGKEMIDDVLSKIDQDPFADSARIATTMYGLQCLADGVDLDPLRMPPRRHFNVDSMGTANWTLALPTILLQSFIPVIQPNHCPFYRKGHFGPVDTSKPYGQRSNQEKFNSDREAVLDILGEFVFLTKVDNAALWLKDEITQTMMEMMVSKKVTLHHSFCMQIFLDVGNVLESRKVGPFNDLRMTAFRAKKSLTNLLGLINKYPIVEWTKPMTEEVQSYLDLSEHGLLKDVWLHLKVKSAPTFNHVEFHLLKEHPILAGLTMYDVNLALQDIGLTVVNTYRSVFPLLHLYNLLENSPGVPTVDWKDLDLFVKFHDEKNIFVGERPEGIEDGLKRLLLFWGMSAKLVSRFVNSTNGKTENDSRHRHRTGNPRAIAPTTILAAAFRLSLAEERKAPFSIAIVEKVLEFLESLPDSATHGVNVTKSPFYNLKQKWKSTKTLTPLQLLTTLRKNLSTEEPRLLYNYIGLHERCLEFYEKLEAHLNDKLAQYNGRDYMKGKEPPFVVFYIMHAALMSSKAQRSLLSFSSSDTEFGSIMLRKSGDQMREYTSGKGGKGEIACKELRVFSKLYTKLIEEGGSLEAKKKEEKDFYWTAIEDIVDPRALAMYQFGQLDGGRKD